MNLTNRSVALLFGAEALVLALCVFALADRRVHQRDPIFGVNQWGYRDEARGSKEPGELRVALVGGSSAFEAALPYTDTLAGQLFIELRAAGSPTRQVYSVVNLAEPRASADGYAQTLRDYAYLNADVVCIFDGYDALEGAAPRGRRRSPAFRAVGYLPMLPARLLGRPGWLSDPDEGIADVLRDGTSGPAEVTCAGTAASYCEAMAASVRVARQQGRAVMVVSPPTVSMRHATLQHSLAGALGREFGRDSQVAALDLGTAIDFSDPEESKDRLHRTAIGNHVVGQKIANTLLQWPAFISRQRVRRAGDSR